MKYTLPQLSYAYNSLEPFIDAQTMEIHHSKHHQAYINNLNVALESHPELEEQSLEQLLRNLDSVPEDVRTAVRNNGGGHYNHSFFWEILKANGGAQPTGQFMEDIAKHFGDIESFKQQFGKAAMSRFGSGWAWLVENETGLEIVSTPNQDSPIMQGQTPLVGLDVWEHAYYLKYQNKRNEYIENFWNVINWELISERYGK